METTLIDVMRFVRHTATDEDVERIMRSVRARTARADQKRADEVAVGAYASTLRLRPAYLNGLQGKIVSISDGHASLRLSEASTRVLKYAPRNTRYIVRDTSYLLGGIPLGCLQVGPSR